MRATRGRQGTSISNALVALRAIHHWLKIQAFRRKHFSVPTNIKISSTSKVKISLGTNDTELNGCPRAATLVGHVAIMTSMKSLTRQFSELSTQLTPSRSPTAKQLRCVSSRRPTLTHHLNQRSISTTARRLAIEPATEGSPTANFQGPPPTSSSARQSQTERSSSLFRPVPRSPSYFSSSPAFADSFLLLTRLVRQTRHLPTIKPGASAGGGGAAAPAGAAIGVSAARYESEAWKTVSEYRAAGGQAVKATDYARALAAARRLASIDPAAMPARVRDAVEPFRRAFNPLDSRVAVGRVDKFGRSLGAGGRKASSARAWVVPGTGEVLVNGKNLVQAFPRVRDRESAIWPLKVTGRVGHYNVWALVQGGGTTGQAEAVTLAVAKALLAQEPQLAEALMKCESISHVLSSSVPLRCATAH